VILNRMEELERLESSEGGLLGDALDVITSVIHLCTYALVVEMCFNPSR
jgi:hypothetical protein